MLDLKWYIFIDDDNLILDDIFLYEIPFYELKGYSPFNPVLKIRRGKSKLAFLMDYPIDYNDITIFGFFTGILKSPLIGMHDEMLGVKEMF